MVEIRTASPGKNTRISLSGVQHTLKSYLRKVTSFFDVTAVQTNVT